MNNNNMLGTVVQTMVIVTILGFFIFILYTGAESIIINRDMTAYIQDGLYSNDHVYIQKVDNYKYIVKGDNINDIVELTINDDKTYSETISIQK